MCVVGPGLCVCCLCVCAGLHVCCLCVRVFACVVSVCVVSVSVVSVCAGLCVCATLCEKEIASSPNFAGGPSMCCERWPDEAATTRADITAPCRLPYGYMYPSDKCVSVSVCVVSVLREAAERRRDET